jgi:hypothetical protein
MIVREVRAIRKARTDDNEHHLMEGQALGLVILRPKVEESLKRNCDALVEMYPISSARLAAMRD